MLLEPDTDDKETGSYLQRNLSTDFMPIVLAQMIIAYKHRSHAHCLTMFILIN